MRSRFNLLLKAAAGCGVLSDAIKKFFKDDCLTSASSMSFVFLLSLIPFATLNVMLFNAIQRSIISQAEWNAKLIGMVTDELHHMIAVVSKSWVQMYLINPEAYGSFTVFSLVMLPIISGFIFHELEVSYRKIFHLPGRHLLLRQAFYAMISIFAVVLLYTADFFGLIISSTVQHLGTLLSGHSYLNRLISSTSGPVLFFFTHLIAMAVLITFFLATVGISLDVRVKLKHRLCCALLFSGLWLVARWLFKLYLVHISKVNIIYGSLSSITVILLWVFYSSIVLLLSIEVMYVLHVRWK